MFGRHLCRRHVSGLSACALPLLKKTNQSLSGCLKILATPHLGLTRGGGLTYRGRAGNYVSKTSCRNLTTTSQAERVTVADVSASLIISQDQKTLTLRQVKGRELRFQATWMRHNCHCPECKQAYSGQKLLDPHLLKPQYTLQEARLQDGVVQVTWENEAHVGVLPLEFLEESDYSAEAKRTAYTNQIPSVAKGGIPSIAYDVICGSEEGVFEWMKQLNEYGLSLVHGVPTNNREVKKAAEHISTIQRTIYDEVFDVVSTPRPINVAYSSVELGLHMDLVYYESPPGLQFLHCLKFDASVEGGYTVLVDAWYEAERMRTQTPELFHTLTVCPATFQKIHTDREHPVHIRSHKPHIVLGPEQTIVGINWAPAFEGPLCIPEEEIEGYYEAYHTYARMLENSDSRNQLRLQPGDMIAYNNRRMLHGRTGFTLNDGMRHLQGCYLHVDEFKSRMILLARKLEPNHHVKRIFNHSYY